MTGNKKNLMIVGGVVGLAVCAFSTQSGGGEQSFIAFAAAIGMLLAVALIIGGFVGIIVFVYMLFRSARPASAFDDSFSKSNRSGGFRNDFRHMFYGLRTDRQIAKINAAALKTRKREEASARAAEKAAGKTAKKSGGRMPVAVTEEAEE